MKRMAVLSTFINAEIFLAEIEHHIFVFLGGSTDSLSWTPTEETVLRVEKKWAGAIGIPLQRGGQLIERRWRRHRWRRRRGCWGRWPQRVILLWRFNMIFWNDIECYDHKKKVIKGYVIFKVILSVLPIETRKIARWKKLYIVNKKFYVRIRRTINLFRVVLWNGIKYHYYSLIYQSLFSSLILFLFVSVFFSSETLE